MAKYSDIKGFTVQTLSSDTVASQFLGGSWSTGGSLNTGRYGGGGDFGTQTAAMVATDTGPSNYGDAVEQYNGTSWTEVAEVNTGRFQSASGGTQTAAILASGRISTPSVTTNVELWDGSSWTETTENNNGRFGSSPGIGTSTAMVFAGGQTITAMVNHVESWNGSAWTEVANYPNSWDNPSNAGTSTAAIYAGGFGGPGGRGGDGALKSAAYNWNGSSYTAVTSLPGNRAFAGSSGSQTNAIVFGGGVPDNTATNLNWDGSSWTEGGDLATARQTLGAGKSNSSDTASSIAYGGPPTYTDTEEWTAPAVFGKQVEGQLFFNSTTNTFKETILDVPNGVWSSGGNLNTGRYTGGGYGSSNSAAGVAGGTESPGVVNEHYNGTSWTEVNDLNTSRVATVGSGTTTAALVYGDHPPNRANAESWDGTNFTEVADLNTARGYLSGTGTANTANLAIGGFASPPTQRLTVCEQYDGSSWTEVGDLTRSVGMNSTGATSGSPYTSALCIGGYSATPPTRSALVEEWNGTSWTSSTTLSTGRVLGVGNGDSVNNVLFAGGNPAPGGGETEYWNGSSWTEFADTVVTNEFRQSGGTASATNGILCGRGNTPRALTEEWNAPLANKTITTS